MAMLSNRLAFAALAAACIGAAAGGGYLATRQNTVPTPASAQTQPPAVTAPNTASPAAPLAAAPSAPARAARDAEPVVAGTSKKSLPASKTSVTRQAELPVRTSAPRNDHAATVAAAHRETTSLIASNNAPAQPPAPPLPPAAEIAPPAPRPE